VNDWVPTSRRTLRYTAVASLLWLGGYVAGMLSTGAGSALDVVSDVSFLAMIGLAMFTIGWSALQCTPRSRLRAGWLLVTAALLEGFVASAYLVTVAWHSPQYPFNGVAPGLTLAFLIGGLGLAIGASSIGRIGNRLVPFLQALGLSVLMFLVMVGALLAPGPTMPFAVGPRDVAAFWKLSIDCGLLLLPATYATLAQLRLPKGHRARAWMWVSAAALVLAMGDVGAPLVDLGPGQLYPIVLWGLGVVLIGVAASLLADFELAERAEESRDASATTLAPQPDGAAQVG
jgi:hypothetical protein